MPIPPYLSIVIPAFNEQDRLRTSLPVLRDYLKKQSYDWELIVVDDGSSDLTQEVPGEFFSENNLRVQRHPGNRGKGYSVRQGVLAAQGEVVLLTDADFSTPIPYFDTLRSRLDEGYDIVIGSRSLANSVIPVRQPWYRQGMGRIFNRIVQAVVMDGFIDTQCGFKCFRRQTAGPLFEKMTIDRFSFDVEFLFLAKKRGLKILEVPVEWKNVLQSRVRIIRDSTQMFIDIFRIRLNDWRGRYDK